VTGKYVVGVDYGTLPGRALVVRVEDGKELASAVHPYRHAVLTESLPSAPDRSLPPDRALQVPSNYVDVLRHAVPEDVAAAGIGPAAHAAVAAGAYADIRAAAKAMGSVQKAVYVPDETRALAYDELFAEYTALHDYFGRGGNDVMYRLRAGRRRALASGVS